MLLAISMKFCVQRICTRRYPVGISAENYDLQVNCSEILLTISYLLLCTSNFCDLIFYSSLFLSTNYVYIPSCFHTVELYLPMNHMILCIYVFISVCVSLLHCLCITCITLPTLISCLQQIRVFLSINLIMLFLFHMTSLRNLESSSFSYRLIFFAYELITAILKTTLVHEFKTPTM
jgi:hypothetical protein